MSASKIKPGKIAFLIIIISLFTSGCSPTVVYKKRGLELINSGKYDAAIDYYKKILQSDPGNTTVKTFLRRAELYSYYYHLALARNFGAAGNRDSAVGEYRKAMAIYPGNKELEREFNTFLKGGQEEEVVVPPSDIEPPVKLNIEGKKIDSISLRSTPIKQIFRTVGRSYGINFIFDKDFRDFPFTFEVGNIGFYDIVNQLCLVSDTKYRVIDPVSVLIYPNTAFKKRAFDLKGVKVFFLSNVMAEDAKKILIPLFRDEQIMVQEDTNLNAVIVKGNSSVLSDIEKFLRKIDKAKSEVEFDIEILEINRNLLNKIGTDFGTTLATMKAGLENESGGVDSTLNVNNLNSTSFFLTLPTVALNLLGTDDNSKILAKPNLRGVNGEDIKFMVGDEIPIPQTTLQAIAAGGIESSPVTTYTYKNVGVEIKLTPFVHKGGEVTVKLKLTMNFVTTYIDKFPVLGKRELENIIRLKEGESSIIGGFIRDESRGVIAGIPLLSKLPILGKLFGSSEDTIRQTDIIFSITPKFIREVRTDKESRSAIWADDSNDSGDAVSKEPEPLTGGRPAEPVTNTGNNMVLITPSSINIKENTPGIFTIRLNSASEVSTLSLSGSIEGGNAEIESLDTGVEKDDKIKVLQNFSGSSFDIGYSFFDRPIKSGNLGTIKVKFSEKGKYRIRLDSVFASFNRTPVKLESGGAEINVY